MFFLIRHYKEEDVEIFSLDCLSVGVGEVYLGVNKKANIFINNVFVLQGY